MNWYVAQLRDERRDDWGFQYLFIAAPNRYAARNRMCGLGLNPYSDVYGTMSPASGYTAKRLMQLPRSKEFPNGEPSNNICQFNYDSGRVKYAFKPEPVV